MWSLVILVCFSALHALGGPNPRLVSRSELISLPIHSLQARDAGENLTVGAGLSPVSPTKDRQSYFTVIKAGKIHFRVALDTASSDLWIVSSGCDTQQCKSVPRYPLNYESDTFVVVNDNQTTFKASYVDTTSVSGFIAKETIQLDNVTVPEQTFGLATQSNVTLTDQMSGILGLGFARLSSISNTTNSTPFFPTLAQKGLLEYPLFALSLTRNYTGSLSIGAIDASVVKNSSEIAWTQVASFPPFLNEKNITTATYLQWAVPLTSFAVNGSSLTPIPTYTDVGGSLALIDIGASGIYGPVQDVSRLFSMIEGSRVVESSGQWAIPCDTTVPISFEIGSRNYTLLPEDYIIGPASGNPNLCLSWPRALPPHSDGIDWQLGSAFLRTVYSIYSYGIDTKEPPLIGLYSLRNETAISSAPANATQAAQSLAAFLSSESATVPTTFPNFVLPTPTYTTPTYTFNASVTATVGVVLSSGLATSNYSAIFGTATTFNATAIPTITPEPSIFTLISTNPSGQVSTTTSTAIPPAIPLGIPPEWGAAFSIHDHPRLYARLVLFTMLVLSLPNILF